MTADLSWLRRAAGAPPLVVAHRGASAAAPENTLAAFRLAVEQGAPAVECDVHLTADGTVVVIHDATVDRTTNGNGEVSRQRYEDLRRLDAGSWFGARFAGEHLPTLDEALGVTQGRTRLFVEIKRGGGEALVAATLAAIGRAGGADVTVISFGPEEIQLVARTRPDLPLGFLISQQHVARLGPAAAVQAARGLGAAFISPHHEAADASFLSAAREAALPISVWTVDDVERMRALAGLGVDAITTNRPDAALALFPDRG